MAVVVDHIWGDGGAVFVVLRLHHVVDLNVVRNEGVGACFKTADVNLSMVEAFFFVSLSFVQEAFFQERGVLV